MLLQVCGTILYLQWRSDYLTRGVCTSIERVLLSLDTREGLLELTGDLVEMALDETFAQLAPFDGPLRLAYAHLGGREAFLTAKVGWYAQQKPLIRAAFAEMLAADDDDAWMFTRIARHLRQRIRPFKKWGVVSSSDAAGDVEAGGAAGVAASRRASPPAERNAARFFAEAKAKRATWDNYSSSADVLAAALEQGTVVRLQTAYRRHLKQRGGAPAAARKAVTKKEKKSSVVGPVVPGMLWA